MDVYLATLYEPVDSRVAEDLMQQVEVHKLLMFFHNNYCDMLFMLYSGGIKKPSH